MTRVLIVDDSRTVRNTVSGALSQAGFLVSEASDGASGLELARELVPAIIILDVNMPFMSGLDVLDALKGHPITREIPVVLLTTEAARSQIERARKAGARAWLIKPVPVDHIVSTAAALTGHTVRTRAHS
jgi:two-component system chemotaxis response regulator CheY